MGHLDGCHLGPCENQTKSLKMDKCVVESISYIVYPICVLSCRIYIYIYYYTYSICFLMERGRIPASQPIFILLHVDCACWEKKWLLIPLNAQTQKCVAVKGQTACDRLSLHDALAADSIALRSIGNNEPRPWGVEKTKGLEHIQAGCWNSENLCCLCNLISSIQRHLSLNVSPMLHWQFCGVCV